MVPGWFVFSGIAGLTAVQKTEIDLVANMEFTYQGFADSVEHVGVQVCKEPSSIVLHSEFVSVVVPFLLLFS